RPICAGTVRSSNPSSWGRKRGEAGRRCVRPRGARLEVRFRSQERNPMMLLLSRTGLRYHGNAIAVGAQTERQGEARAGEGSAWRRNLTGHFSFQESRVQLDTGALLLVRLLGGRLPSHV